MHVCTQVFEASAGSGCLREPVALKVIDMPTSIHDPCYQARPALLLSTSHAQHLSRTNAHALLLTACDWTWETLPCMGLSGLMEGSKQRRRRRKGPVGCISYLAPCLSHPEP
jgi:hypothetical protein